MPDAATAPALETQQRVGNETAGVDTVVCKVSTRKSPAGHTCNAPKVLYCVTPGLFPSIDLLTPQSVTVTTVYRLAAAD